MLYVLHALHFVKYLSMNTEPNTRETLFHSILNIVHLLKQLDTSSFVFMTNLKKWNSKSFAPRIVASDFSLDYFKWRQIPYSLNYAFLM